jgi:hypothetical protein
MNGTDTFTANTVGLSCITVLLLYTVIVGRVVLLFYVVEYDRRQCRIISPSSSIGVVLVCLRCCSCAKRCWSLEDELERERSGRRRLRLLDMTSNHMHEKTST